MTEAGKSKHEDFQVEVTSVALWAQAHFGWSKMKRRLALEKGDAAASPVISQKACGV